MVTGGMAAAHRSFPSCSCHGFQNSCRGSFSPGQELRAVGNPLLQLSCLPRPDGDLRAGKGCPQERQRQREAPVQMPPGHWAVCTEESPHAEDRSPAPTGASASPQLAQYGRWWVSATKGPQEHPLKWSEPKTHLALPLQAPAVIKHPHHESTRYAHFEQGAGAGFSLSFAVRTHRGADEATRLRSRRNYISIQVA